MTNNDALYLMFFSLIAGMALESAAHRNDRWAAALGFAFLWTATSFVIKHWTSA